MPALTANTAIVVNSVGTALTNTTGTLALAGNFSTTGTHATTLIQGADVSLTLPVVSGTLATLAGTETLSNKTLVAPALGTPVSGVATNLTGTAAGLTAGNVTTNANLTGVITSSGNTTSIASQTGTGTKFVVDTSPTIVGLTVTTSFTATGLVTNADLAGSVAASKLVGTDIVTVGTLTAGAIASGFTSINAVPIGASAASTGAFTTLSATSTVSGAGFSTYFASPPAIGGTAPAAAAFTTLTVSTPIAASSLATMTATVGGAVPTPPNNTTTFLRGDGTFAAPAPSGTVTTVSVAPANGFSGTVANATSTPAITIIAGAITPASVNGNTFTTGTYTLTGGAGKALTFNNSITLAGADSTTMTFPSSSDTVATIAAAQTLTNKTITFASNTLTGVAPLASPALTGTPSAPTATGGTNTTQIATTAFVLGNVPSPIIAAGAIGSYTIAYQFYPSFSVGSNYSPMAGTWRCTGVTEYGNGCCNDWIGIFQRIA